MVPKKYVHASIFPFFFLSTNNQYRYVFVRYQKMLSNILTNILSGFTRRFEMLPYFHIWEWERKQELKDELKHWSSITVLMVWLLVPEIKAEIVSSATSLVTVFSLIKSSFVAHKYITHFWNLNEILETQMSTS